MFRKYSLLVCLLPLLTVAPAPVQAQTTTDITILIQNISDQFARIRGAMKQLESTLNIEQMAKNLGDLGAIKGLADKFKGIGETVQAKTSPLLPTQIADSPDDIPNSSKFMRTEIAGGKAKTPEETLTEVDNQKDFIYVGIANGYGKAIAFRNELETDFAGLAAMQEAAKNSESDMELMQLINEVALKTYEQEQKMLAIKAAANEAENLIRFPGDTKYAKDIDQKK